jgi:hypothetical protein
MQTDRFDFDEARFHLKNCLEVIQSLRDEYCKTIPDNNKQRHSKANKAALFLHKTSPEHLERLQKTYFHPLQVPFATFPGEGL